MENHEYWQGVSSKSLVQIFGKHASPTQDCIVEQRAEEKRKIAEFVRVHGVVAIQLGKVAGQCAMPYTLILSHCPRPQPEHCAGDTGQGGQQVNKSYCVSLPGLEGRRLLGSKDHLCDQCPLPLALLLAWI